MWYRSGRLSTKLVDMSKPTTNQLLAARATERGNDGLTAVERSARAARYAARNARPLIGQAALEAHNARRAARRAAR